MEAALEVCKSTYSNWCIQNIVLLLGKPSKSGSSCPEVFCSKGVLKNFAIFTGKHLYWNLFLIKLHAWRPATLLKRDSNTDFFLLRLRNFLEQIFLQNISGECFWKVHTENFSLKPFFHRLPVNISYGKRILNIFFIWLSNASKMLWKLLNSF